MKLAVLFSGGKDSTFALFWALVEGFEPVLFSVYAESDSTMFHHPNIEKTALQAKALGLKRIIVKTNEKDWHTDLKKAIKKEKCHGIVGGAIASEYQKRRFERIAQELGIPSYAPLWHKGDEYLDEVCAYFETYVVSVSAEGLGENDVAKSYQELVGKILQINSKRTSNLRDTDYFIAGNENKVSISPFLEGGEGETFVCDAPFFKTRIQVRKWNTTVTSSGAHSAVSDAILKSKKY